MPIMPNELKRVERSASLLIAKNRVQSPPVRVEEIARSLSLDLVAYDLGDGVSGALIIENGKGVIGVNPRDPKTRQRFTIAHEIGHFQLHNKTKGEKLFVDKDFIVKYRNSNNYNSEELKHEQEANAFAAELLMPREFICAELAKKSFAALSEPELIEELAKLFEVSVPAMTFRLSNMNLAL